MAEIKMTSQKPYLIPALYEWILDNNCTPYIVLSTKYPEVQIPQHFYQQEQLVLNLSPNAVKNLHMDNVALSFDARFNGIARSLYIPFAAISSIYANETGQGMMFVQEIENNHEPEPTPPTSPAPKPSKKTNKPVLKLVK